MPIQPGAVGFKDNSAGGAQFGSSTSGIPGAIPRGDLA